MHHKHVVYPFTAIVGQEKMKLALILNAINPQNGGVLIRGKKGTAKSTAARGLAHLLPEIEVIVNCPFSCNPNDLREMCKACQERKKKKEKLPIKKRKMFVIDMPVSATEDRIVGTIDIEKAIKQGIKALQPGILAEANRGILYIDEVNLLDDHAADVLLDSAAMGVNTIEREGISVYHPARFILIGTMNPEEGELRPQLLDRFGLCVQVANIEDVNLRAKIVKSREDFDLAPWKFRKRYERQQGALRKKIVEAKKLLPQVKISDDLVLNIAQVCIDTGTDGHRAEIITTRCAKTIAAFEGRNRVTEEDVRRAFELTLSHRMRRKPFEEPEIRPKELEQIWEKAVAKSNPKEKREKRKRKDNSPTVPKEETFEIGQTVNGEKILERHGKQATKMAKGKSFSLSNKSVKRGKYIKFRIPKGKINDVALDATLRAAAQEQSVTNERNLLIKEGHLREKIRKNKGTSLVVLVVDASGSIGVEQRMKFVKGVVASLLATSYRKRNKVAMIAVRGEKSITLLPPTRSVDLAMRYIQELPTGGKTPLPGGILKGIELIKNEIRKDKSISPVLILVTDGKGNIPVRENVVRDLEQCAEEVRKEGLETIVVDAEAGPVRLGLAKELCKKFGGRYYHIHEIDNKQMATIVGEEY